jgi:large subunit ribosomal protein L5
MEARLKEEYKKNIMPTLTKEFGYKSVMQVPKIQKIVLNVGMGDAHANAKGLEATITELTQITGQKPIKTISKKSIATFKIRDGMILGTMVTLRGNRMYEFLDRLLNFALPRVRDFNGLSRKAFDGKGNYNFSVKEQIIFPEIDFDKVENVHGINVTIVTNAKSDQEAMSLLEKFNMPFKKK